MIMITGASGTLASLVVGKARNQGIHVLTSSRSGGADRQMDFDRQDTLDFSGVDTLFVTSAGYAEDDVVIRRHGDVLRAAARQGVKHVIYTSLSANSDHLGFALAHRWTEQALQRSGMAWTILRNGLYAELIGMLAAPQDGRITAPFGDARISAVAREDLATAAVKVLENPESHAGRIYELSGRAGFSVPDLARSMGVEYEPTSLAEQRSRLDALDMLPFQRPMIMSIYAAAIAGFLESESSDVTQLVDNPASPLDVARSSAVGAIRGE